MRPTDSWVLLMIRAIKETHNSNLIYISNKNKKNSLQNSSLKFKFELNVKAIIFRNLIFCFSINPFLSKKFLHYCTKQLKFIECPLEREKYKKKYMKNWLIVQKILKLFWKSWDMKIANMKFNSEDNGTVSIV